MKHFLFIFTRKTSFLFFLSVISSFSLFAQNAETNSLPEETSTTSVAENSVEQSDLESKSAIPSEDVEEDSEAEDRPKSIVPEAKRPKKPDSEKVRLAENTDIGKDAVQEKKDTLKFGIESDITSLLSDLSSKDDPRFVEEIYDLFQQTKSDKIRVAILDYFAKLEDPCIEDYAVTILNDPYDEKSDLVSSVFKYTAAVKCSAAVPAVMNLLENDNESYFDNALTTIGAIGSEKEADVLAEYLDREDLTISQRQTLMKVLGSIKAVSTWDKLSEIIQNDDENTFIRSYAAEAIGAMKKPESLPILKELYENNDPNLRTYALKGLSYFDRKEVEDIFIEAIRDSYYKVRLEAISAVDKLEIKNAVPSLIYRSKNDPEASVKKACYPVIAKLDTREGKNYLLGILGDKKIGDNTKALAVEAILKYAHTLPSEVANLAEETLKDDMRKPLRYSIGKQFVKYANTDNLHSDFISICEKYLSSKDTSTQGIGLDLYAIGHYSASDATVKAIAEAEKKSVNRTKARKILKMDDEN